MPVEVVIHVRNLELTDRLREYVEKKVSKLDRFLDVLEEIYRQIERYKGRHWRTRGDGRPLSEVVAETGPLAEAPEENPEVQIARRKQFLLVPMTEPEA